MNIVTAVEIHIEKSIKVNNLELFQMFGSYLEQYLSRKAELKNEISSVKGMIGLNTSHPMKSGKISVATKGVQFYGFLSHHLLLQNVVELCVIGRYTKLCNEGTVANYFEKMLLSLQ